VILALSFTPHPSGGTTELLGSLQDDPLLGRQSRYGLGVAAARADQLLAAALRADSSKEVRLSAATALDYRQSSKVLVEALESCLTVEPERDVRLQATRVALKWASEQPRLRDVLVRLAKHDPDKKIREVAGAVG
jgi:hypothetical protein